MAKDKGERKHRRTARNVNCVEMMAGADFDAAPSLSEAMGLEDGPAVTHIGWSRTTGYVHSGRLHGHGINEGKRHALVIDGTPANRTEYAALCGQAVEFSRFNEWGEESPNFAAAADSTPSCKRCLKLLGK